jgi:hypothetical protein
MKFSNQDSENWKISNNLKLIDYSLFLGKYDDISLTNYLKLG